MAITMATVWRCALKSNPLKYLLGVMAKLDLESSGESGGYSDSFELEESISLDQLESSVESDTKISVVAQAKKTRTSGIDTQKAAASVNRIQPKSKLTSSKITNSVKSKNQTDTINHKRDSVDLSRTMRSPLNITKQAESASGHNSNQQKSGSTFKHAIQNIRTMQSVVNTIKNFNDSLEVRDTVYGEWLARKTSQVSREKSSKVLARKLEDEKKRQKEIELAQRSTKAVEQWSASKEIELRKARKQKIEEMKKAKEESNESVEKRQAAEVASKKWREEKTRELASWHRERKRKEREEVKRKEEEMAEKAQYASQAFQAWSKRKEEVIKREKQKQREHKQQLKQAKAKQEHLRREDSSRAFEAWKGNKDKTLTSTKTLYTYREDGRRKVHEKAWCPARSMQYTYPKAKANDVKNKKPVNGRTSSRSESVVASYSSASFESTDNESEADSFIADEESTHSSGIGPSAAHGSKGLRRTIQVCCQTLEYWCTCDHNV